MTTAVAPDLVIHRRKRRSTPLHARRIGTALDAKPTAGDPAAAFPGLDLDASKSRRARFYSSGVSLLLHGGLLLALLLAAWLAPVEEKEELIKLERVADEVAKQEPAARPRVVQERLSPVFNPSAMAVAPQIVNPVVVKQAAPAVTAQKIDVDAVATVTAPTEIARATPVVVSQAQAFQSPVQVTTQPVKIDSSGPAVRGPVESVAPVGIQSGPKQVAMGDTTGIADARALGTGSSVREGIVSGRDVHGAQTGVRADVHTAVGEGNLRGEGGGNGTGPGGVSWDDCWARPEVQQYIARVKERMYARWTVSDVAAGIRKVDLAFQLDPAGTVSRVKLVKSDDANLGRSAVDALQAASPFSAMPDRVRCLANVGVIGTFTTEPERVAN